MLTLTLAGKGGFHFDSSFPSLPSLSPQLERLRASCATYAFHQG